MAATHSRTRVGPRSDDPQIELSCLTVFERDELVLNGPFEAEVATTEARRDDRREQRRTNIYSIRDAMAAASLT